MYSWPNTGPGAVGSLFDQKYQLYLTTEREEVLIQVSNIPLVVFPVVQYIMYQSYASLCQPNLRFLLLTLQVVGVGSTYYHATLS